MYFKNEGGTHYSLIIILEASLILFIFSVFSFLLKLNLAGAISLILFFVGLMSYIVAYINDYYESTKDLEDCFKKARIVKNEVKGTFFIQFKKAGFWFFSEYSKFKNLNSLAEATVMLSALTSARKVKKPKYTVVQVKTNEKNKG